MKKTTLTGLLLIILLMGGTLALSTGRGIRCGSDLVLPGYLKYEVRQSCGEPLSKELVGEVEYRDTGSIYDRRDSRFRNRESRVFLYIEEWLYHTDSLHVLRFEGNTLVTVESVRRK